MVNYYTEKTVKHHYTLAQQENAANSEGRHGLLTNSVYKLY